MPRYSAPSLAPPRLVWHGLTHLDEFGIVPPAPRNQLARAMCQRHQRACQPVELQRLSAGIAQSCTEHEGPTRIARDGLDQFDPGKVVKQGNRDLRSVLRSRRSFKGRYQPLAIAPHHQCLGTEPTQPGRRRSRERNVLIKRE